jgi:transcriptional regulator with XRE-family HTH domain
MAALVLMDPPSIRDARERSGWTQAGIAAALGVAPNVIHRLEAGADQQQLDLGFAHDLCRALGTTLAELISPAALTTIHDHDRLDHSDVERMGAAIADHHDMVSIDSLAFAFEWSLERTLVALDRLALRLVGTGLALAWHTDTHVRIVPSRINNPVAETLNRGALLHRGANAKEARILQQLAHAPRRIPAPPPVVISRLIATGLVRVTLDSGTRTTRARSYLDLTELGFFTLGLENPDCAMTRAEPLKSDDTERGQLSLNLAGHGSTDLGAPGS